MSRQGLGPTTGKQDPQICLIEYGAFEFPGPGQLAARRFTTEDRAGATADTAADFGALGRQLALCLLTADGLETAGQHQCQPGKPLRLAFEAGRLHSFILWGPPGVGKTTLGRLAANATNSRFIALSAVLAGVKDIRQTVDAAREAGLTSHQVQQIVTGKQMPGRVAMDRLFDYFGCELLCEN